jgi:ankyrin repeat protein
MAHQLLDYGAKTDIYGGKYGSALIATARAISDADGGVEIAEKIIDGGCDVNYEGPPNTAEKTALCAAINLCNSNMVKLLLDRGANPNVTGCGSCDNALQFACQNGDETIVHHLLNNGADITLRGGKNNNCLSAACASGNDNLVKTLLEAGMSPNEKGGPYTYPLIRAAVLNKTSCVRTLLEAGADPMSRYEVNGKKGVIALQVATSEELLALLVDKGSDVDFYGIYGNIPNALWWAAARGDESTCRMLIEKGASLTVKHPKSGTPIVSAVFSGSVSLMKLFVAKGADVNLVQDCYYFGSAVHGAAAFGHEDLLKYLISIGADINVTHWESGSPIMVANRQREGGCLTILGEAGASQTGTNMIGRNALHESVPTSNYDFFNKLIGFGFRPDFTDKRGCNALHYAACTADSSPFLLRLIELGVNVNSQDDYQWTPLHWAAASGSGSLVAIECLLHAGGDPSLEDNDGKTPHDLAVGFGKTLEAEMLANPGHYLSVLKQTSNKKRAVWEDVQCDGCMDCPWHRYKCQTCNDFDFCARCLKDKNIIHFPDHVFKFVVVDSMLGEELVLEANEEDIAKAQKANDVANVEQVELKAATVNAHITRNTRRRS